MAKDVLLYGIDDLTDEQVNIFLDTIKPIDASIKYNGKITGYEAVVFFKKVAPEFIYKDSLTAPEFILPNNTIIKPKVTECKEIIYLYFNKYLPYKEAVKLAVLYNLPAPKWSDFAGPYTDVMLLKYQTMAKNANMTQAATVLTTTPTPTTAQPQPTQVTTQPAQTTTAQPQPAPVATTTTTTAQPQPTQVTTQPAQTITPQPQPAPVATTPTTTAQPQPELVATLPSPDEVSTLTITQKEDEGVPWWAWGLLALAGVGGFLLIRRNKKKKQNK